MKWEKGTHSYRERDVGKEHQKPLLISGGTSDSNEVTDAVD